MSDARAACLIALCAHASAGGAAESYPPEVVIAERAPASERGRIWTRRPLALELHGSLAGPYGLVGVAAEYTTSPGFALATGVGLDIEPVGPHWGAMARLRPLIVDRFASGVEGGLSLGRYQADESCEGGECERWRWELAVWGHIALYAEYRQHAGAFARVALGSASVFNVPDGDCTRCDPGSTPALGITTRPYIGVSVGWAPEL